MPHVNTVHRDYPLPAAHTCTKTAAQLVVTNLASSGAHEAALANLAAAEAELDSNAGTTNAEVMKTLRAAVTSAKAAVDSTAPLRPTAVYADAGLRDQLPCTSRTS